VKKNSKKIIMAGKFKLGKDRLRAGNINKDEVRPWTWNNWTATPLVSSKT
jgi:hypothetical protein